MSQDKLRLLKFSIVSCVLVVLWFGLTTLSHNVVAQVLLGWVGFAVVALYYRWLRRKKVEPPDS